jgi:hypothetical protein
MPSGDAICARPKCTKPAVKAGHCWTDYEYWRLTGHGGLTDPGPARARVAELRALGWTFQQIADAAGLAKWVVIRLAQGHQAQIRVSSAAAILLVRPAVVESPLGVDAMGTRRRVQALAWMGWPGAEISVRAGLKPRSLTELLGQGRVSVRVAERVRGVYGDLSGTRGPSVMAASQARRLGFAPPAAWDDIDNPEARPAGVLVKPARPVRSPVRQLRACGTEGAYRRHRRRGDERCDVCWDAHNAGKRDRRAARRQVAA